MWSRRNCTIQVCHGEAGIEFHHPVDDLLCATGRLARQESTADTKLVRKFAFELLGCQIDQRTVSADEPPVACPGRELVNSVTEFHTLGL